MDTLLKDYTPYSIPRQIIIYEMPYPPPPPPWGAEYKPSSSVITDGYAAGSDINHRNLVTAAK